MNIFGALIYIARVYQKLSELIFTNISSFPSGARMTILLIFHQHRMKDYHF